jgi:hypothetical protein
MPLYVSTIGVHPLTKGLKKKREGREKVELRDS